MAAWRKGSRPHLETESWKVLDVVQGKSKRKYLVKGLFSDDGYQVMISDSCSIWEESIHSDAILQRLKDLNPVVEAPLSVLHSTLISHLDSQNESAVYSVDKPDNHKDENGVPDYVILSIQTTMSSLPLEWQFRCSRSTPDKLSTHVVLPLLAMVGELGRRQQYLVQLLAKKDKELQDFSDQGYSVTRKYLKTAPFMSSAFDNEMTVSEGFIETACRDVEILAAPGSQRLYRDVTMIRRSKSGQGTAVASRADRTEVEETTGTWAAKIPASLLPTVPESVGGETGCVATPTTVTSPTKRPAAALDESPSKETELSRREALQKKLEKDKNKAKKKRKLM